MPALLSPAPRVTCKIPRKFPGADSRFRTLHVLRTDNYIHAFGIAEHRLHSHGSGTSLAAPVIADEMKRTLRNTETAMFVKSDGGETNSIYTARCFFSYDDAVAFCKAHKLRTVELVVHPDDQPEYVVALPAKHLTTADDDATSSDIEDMGALTETKGELGAPWSIMPELDSKVPSEPCACERDMGLAAEVHEINPEANGCGFSANGEENGPDCGEAEAVVLAWEIAISMYADCERAAYAPEFHFSPPDKCDVCGTALSERSFFVDGRLSERGEWRDMCSQCFFVQGGRIGAGKGQLYQRQPDEKWLLVGGFGR